jgi:hypothetical protein
MECYVNKYNIADTSMCMSDGTCLHQCYAECVCDYKVTILQMINQEKMQSCSGKYGMYKPNTTLSLNNTVCICTKDTVQKIFKMMVGHYVACHLQVWKNSMPRVHEVTGGTKTKIYYQATICWTCVLAVPCTIKVGLTKVGNQAKPLKYSKIKSYFVSLQSRCSNVQPPT